MPINNGLAQLLSYVLLERGVLANKNFNGDDINVQKFQWR